MRSSDQVLLSCGQDLCPTPGVIPHSTLTKTKHFGNSAGAWCTLNKSFECVVLIQNTRPQPNFLLIQIMVLYDYPVEISLPHTTDHLLAFLNRAALFLYTLGDHFLGLNHHNLNRICQSRLLLNVLLRAAPQSQKGMGTEH